MSSPILNFQSVTFSDGSTFDLDDSDVVVFVGPNNAGKSLALAELEGHLSNSVGSKVVSEAPTRKTGSREEFAKLIERNVNVEFQSPHWTYSAFGHILHTPDAPEQLWPQQFQHFRYLFCKRIATETRISDSDPVNAIDVLNDMPMHPIHMMFKNVELELKISEYFRRAFGEDLILDRASGANWHLMVGERLKPLEGEDRISDTYLNRVRSSTVQLSQQGDGMRSFASVVMHLLTPTTFTLLLLDEPEAFLHPPQARLLGEIIATEKTHHAQLFLATHSPDVLQGLINVAPEHLRILRMQRDGNVNRIKELDKELVKKISYDPIMRYSSVLSGLFHARVIICEGDADCMFYSSILDLPEVHGETHPDVLFVHASGKGQIANLAQILSALDVEVDVIADIDLLRELNGLKATVEALNGDWSTVEPMARAIKMAVEERRPWLNASEVKDEIIKILEDTPERGEFPKRLRSEIQKIFRKASPWDTVKEGGQSALPPGEATMKFQDLHRICSQIGLWLVPVGELEGFCKSVGGHGPRWVQQVIENRDLATDSHLESARKFVKELWESKRHYAAGDTAQGS